MQQFQQAFVPAIGILCLIVASRAVPLSMVMNSPGIVIPNSLDDDARDINNDDDFTTHPLERLSSAATCLVAGVEYTHGQQIYRRDQCEFCLCLDGEMFCWWQECPPTQEGPCKDRAPFTPCQNGNTVVTTKPQLITTTTLQNGHKPTTMKTYASEVVRTTTIIEETEEPSSTADNTDDEIETSTEMIGDFYQDHLESQQMQRDNHHGSTSTDVPTVCTVMGRQYKIGDRLPHDTGNCVECICGNGAQITCSPQQCAPSSDADEINDYRPPGLRAAQPDVF